MAAQDIRYEVDGSVAMITFDRPRYRNAQSWRLLDQLDQALDRAVGYKTVKVAIVTGAGEHFSAGHDLGTPEQIEDRQRRGIPDTGLLDYETFRGWMIAAAMDVVFAPPDARFLAGQVEYFSIPWDVGARKAKELLFESRFITADEARELGFVNRVIAADELERETLAWAKRVGESAHGVLRMAKLASNKIQDVQGSSASMEGAFADFLVLAQMAGTLESRRRIDDSAESIWLCGELAGNGLASSLTRRAGRLQFAGLAGPLAAAARPCSPIEPHPPRLRAPPSDRSHSALLFSSITHKRVMTGRSDAARGERSGRGGPRRAGSSGFRERTREERPPRPPRSTTEAP